MSEELKALNYDMVRQIVRSISDIAIFDGTLKEKQHRALTEICKIMNIQLFVKCYSHIGEGFTLQVLDTVSNLEGKFLDNYIQSTSLKGDHDPTYEKIVTAMSLQEGSSEILHSFRNDDLFTREEQDEHPFFQKYHKAAGIGSLVYSAKACENGHVASIVFMRPLGEADFSQEEKNLLHIVLNDVPFLYMDKVPEQADKIIDLTPRLNETLKFIIEGYSVAKIADLMCISESTVRGYIKELYKQFLVSSRHELTSIFK